MYKNFLLFAFLLIVNFAPQTLAQTSKRIRTFDVQHYIIRTSFDRTKEVVNGETTVILSPLKPEFKSFNLDAANLQVHSALINSSKKPLLFKSSNNHLSITLDRSYNPNEEVSINIKYTAKPRTGLFFVEPDNSGRLPRPAQIWTQGEPEDNHHWFPSYDFPDDKATSEQFITTEANETAIANGELLEVKTNKNKTKTFHYRMSHPHPTYLVSLIVGKYTKISDQYNSIPLNYYVYPGSETVVQPAFGKTKKMMNVFTNMLRYDYPFNKYDQTIVSAFTFGGMENITATTLSDREIFAALKNEHRIETENLVSHELAHSWFGNLVTCKNWSHLWLNEGFATFFEALFLEHEYGREAYQTEMLNNARMAFIQEDEAGIRHPLVNLRAKPDFLLFDATTYKKGGFVVHMLRETLGDELFWKSINYYLNKHKFETVETADLQKAFEETTGRDLDWFFEQWIRKAGYPTLQIKPTYNRNNKQLTLLIEQKQKPDSQVPPVFRLFADLEITTSFKTFNEKIEINQRQQSFSFALPELPTQIIFDGKNQILKKVEIEPIKEIE